MEENNNFLYKGYLLVISVGGWCFDAECKELDYEDYDYSIPVLKSRFMKVVDEKLEKEKEMTNIIEYKDFQLKLSINRDYLLGEFVQKDVSDIFARPVEELSVPELREKFRERVDYYLRTETVIKWKEDKDRKIAKLIEVIDGLNKKLEEKDKKIERLKSKITVIKLEVNKAE